MTATLPGSLPADLLRRRDEVVAPFRDLYPFEAHWLEVTGGWMHHLDEGPRGAAPILCLHGNPSWSFAWRRLVQRFSAAHRVVVPDHLGCGLSARPLDWSYRLEDHVRHVEELVEALDLRDITLVVHDWGGAIGMGLATRHPGRIARLVVTNTAAFTGGRMPARIALCRTPLLGELLVRGLNGFARAATHMAVERPLEPRVRRAYAAPYRGWNNAIATHRFVLDIPTDERHPSWDTLEAIDAGLARLADLPTLLLWGERDWCFTPAFRTQWQRRFPRAEVVALASAGHYLFEDEPEAFLSAVERFLAEPAPEPLPAGAPRETTPRPQP